jgi:hypothetical protein
MRSRRLLAGRQLMGCNRHSLLLMYSRSAHTSYRKFSAWAIKFAQFELLKRTQALQLRERRAEGDRLYNTTPPRRLSLLTRHLISYVLTRLYWLVAKLAAQHTDSMIQTAVSGTAVAGHSSVSPGTTLSLAAPRAKLAQPTHYNRPK